MNVDIEDALKWADNESSICYSSGTGHSEAKVLAQAYRQSQELIREQELDLRSDMKEFAALKEKIAALKEVLKKKDEALNWLIHMNHGISKSGGESTLEEFKAATEFGEEILALQPKGDKKI